MNYPNYNVRYRPPTPRGKNRKVGKVTDRSTPVETAAGRTEQLAAAGRGRPQIAVIGIGADGWDGLSGQARAEVVAAEVLLGATRQLELIPPSAADRVAWPSPLLPALPGLLERYGDRRLVVLASGDPMFYGIGNTLARLLDGQVLRIYPQPSSVSLACARLCWPVHRIEVISAVGRDLRAIRPVVQPHQRVMVLGANGTTAMLVARLLTDAGYGDSRLWLLEQLGGPAERVHSGTARQWDEPEHDPLAVIAIDCVPDPDLRALPRGPGLPEDAFDHDGQITKRELRALAGSALAPLPGQLLWDVGAGSGSVGIEWMRSHPSCHAIAIEASAERCARIADNSMRLGVPGLRVVSAAAPEAYAGLPFPDAVFVGGAVSLAGVLDGALLALRPAGRLVAHAVTLQAEQALIERYHRHGGSLSQISVARAAPIGRFTGWRPAMPVVQWSYRKERA